MRDFERESIYWYGLLKVAKDDVRLKYQVNVNKETLSQISPIAFLGVFQYNLYRGEEFGEMLPEDWPTIADYIIENYDKLHRVRYRFSKEKPKKPSLKTDQEIAEIKDLLTGLVLPYYNEYCLKTLNSWRTMPRAYIAEFVFNVEYDINHESEDGKLKTSQLYPFLFTLNLINNSERTGLYQRILKYFDRDKILKKYAQGREWKEKEEDYLSETMSMVNSDEEWNLFLSNFSFEKWGEYDMEERFKALFQLSKICSILMKDEITAVTMLGTGDEIYDMLKNYLPLFIYEDKISPEGNIISGEIIQQYEKTISPFSHQHLNSLTLNDYIISKDGKHVEIEPDKLTLAVDIANMIMTKIRIFMLTHEYLPDVIDSWIAPKKKMFVNILKIFRESKPNKFKADMQVAYLKFGEMFILESEILEILALKGVKDPKYHAYKGLMKIGKIISFMIGLNTPTAKIFNYDIHEVIKYIITIFGPHPSDRTIATKVNVDFIAKIFKDFIHWYDKQDYDIRNNETTQLITCLELPSRLLQKEAELKK